MQYPASTCLEMVISFSEMSKGIVIFVCKMSASRYDSELSLLMVFLLSISFVCPLMVPQKGDSSIQRLQTVGQTGAKATNYRKR